MLQKKGNNILDLAEELQVVKSEEQAKRAAIEIAAKKRFTPIVLTSLTTILGLMPLTFSGTSLWFPLGWTLIGGMVPSTLLTLLVVPVLYNWLTAEDRVEKAEKLASA